MNNQPDAGFHEIGLYSNLVERGAALVFEIDPENFISGFAIKYNSKIFCFRNQCPHIGSKLDWTPRHFFDQTGELLVCATHGALFDPVDGKCVNGPCINQRLMVIPIKLVGDAIFAYY